MAQRILRRIVNLPARLLFPAAPRLLGASSSRAYAANAIKPYFEKVLSLVHACCSNVPSLSSAKQEAVMAAKNVGLIVSHLHSMTMIVVLALQAWFKGGDIWFSSS